MTVRRNAYGRQLGSFTAQAPWRGSAACGDAERGEALRGDAGASPLPMTFIRAPKIVEVGPDVEVLASVDDGAGRSPAAVRHGNQVACAFHPELDTDPRIHRLFLEL